MMLDIMPLVLIDAIGPFFAEAGPGRINWSKIPFSSFIGEDGRVLEDRLARVEPLFRAFCERVQRAGYNAITLDDVAHLALHELYPAALRDKVLAFRRGFAPLLDCAASKGLAVYFTTDAPSVPVSAGPRERTYMQRPAFLAELVSDLIAWRPEIAGVIVRVGESDGHDVRDDFRSELRVRTIRDCSKLVEALLDVCEPRGKTVVFRTWTVGAYRIGDLIWNTRTCSRVFEPFARRALIVSMKYGESDFFRFLDLNQNFLHGSYRKMIELPARREYEGCGEYPSCIAWEYDRYLRELALAGVVLAGVMVWCQTGGWTRFRRLSFLQPEGIWNEINAWIVPRLLLGEDVEQAIAHWCRAHGRGDQAYDVLHVLRLSDEAVRGVLYIDEFARQRFFFRRLRIPPLLWVFWDQIILSRAMARLLDLVLRDTRRQILVAETALQTFPRMIQLARRAALPEGDLRFMRDTFAILALARRWLFMPASEAALAHLRAEIKRYVDAHPNHYVVHLDARDNPGGLRRSSSRRLMRVLLRSTREYRWVDRLFTLRVLAWLYPVFRRRLRIAPDFARETAMGLDALFK